MINLDESWRVRKAQKVGRVKKDTVAQSFRVDLLLFIPIIALLFFSCAKNPATPSNNLTPALMLAYSSNTDGDWDIYIQNPIGANPVKLTYNDYDDWNPCISPSGELIVYESYYYLGSCFTLFIMDIDGQNKELLVQDGSASYGCFNLEDSRAIAYYFSGIDAPTYLYTVSVVGHISGRLIQERVDSFPTGLSWYGDWIAYCDTSDGISLYNFDTDSSTYLTQGECPTFSPDGVEIAFIDSNAIFLINRDGTERQSLNLIVSTPQSLSWSPDGQYIFYQHANGINKFDLQNNGDFDVLVNEFYPRNIIYANPSVGYATR